MPKSRAILIGLLCQGVMLVAALLPANPATAAEQRIALVIGNSAYPSARLRNPVNDANAMAQKLRTLGFEVMLSTDATQREMSRAISEFGKKLKLGSVGLFYFAGHGMQVRGKNFLIPVDAEIETEGAVRGEAVDVEHVLDQLGAAQLSMIILDACRNNPFETRFRRVGGGLAQIDAPTGSLLAYATAPGKVASDGPGNNGLYTAALLKALDIPGLKVEDVFKQVRNDVLKESDKEQIPWESSSLTMEFYFRPGATVQIDTVKLQKSEKERAELLKEVEKLRTELLSFKDTPGTAKPAPATPAGSTLASADSATPVGSTAQSAQQIAVATVVPSTAATTEPASNAVWDQRLRRLESLKGKLTYSKALAILLDISSEQDLELLITLEKHLTGARWANAHAMGVTDRGKPFWTSADGYRTASFATETALEFCTRNINRPCKVIVQNSEFLEKEFFDFANQLKQTDAAAARQSYLAGLAKAPTETPTAGGHGARGGTISGGNAARVFTPALD